jgi:uncharacterized iron-regulated membrane protein
MVSKFNRFIFWTHLICALLTAPVILMMSITGVLLMYEKQVVHYLERIPAPKNGANTRSFSLNDLLKGDQASVPRSITLSVDPAAPIVIGAGMRGPGLYLDPYSGQVIADPAAGTRRFFQLLTAWHRWFALADEHRGVGRMITGASNLVFLYLICSGLYLWMPRIWKWSQVRAALYVRPGLTSGRARDWNRHRVYGFWCALPLAVVVATAVVFSYGWANALVFRLAGESPTAGQRGGPPGMARPGEFGPPGQSTAPSVPPRPLEEYIQAVTASMPEWRILTLQLPLAGEKAVRIDVDRGYGGEPQKRSTLEVDLESAGLISTQSFADQTTGRRWRTLIRFLHTGEALGLVGQTLAGVVSFVSLILIWTGVKLAWRRYIRPLFGATPAQ